MFNWIIYWLKLKPLTWLSPRSLTITLENMANTNRCTETFLPSDVIKSTSIIAVFRCDNVTCLSLMFLFVRDLNLIIRPVDISAWIQSRWKKNFDSILCIKLFFSLVWNTQTMTVLLTTCDNWKLWYYWYFDDKWIWFVKMTHESNEDQCKMMITCKMCEIIFKVCSSNTICFIHLSTMNISIAIELNPTNRNSKLEIDFM